MDINRDDFADPALNYGVPTDNPFFGRAGMRGEIFAYGLRNPWRNGFDRLSGELWLGDVGQDAREEIDRIAAASSGGQNFGWRVREGSISTPGVGGPAEPGMVEPWLDYDRSFGASVTGGYVVRDAASPLYGQYVFGDFISGRIWAIGTAGASQTLAAATELTAVLDAGRGAHWATLPRSAKVRGASCSSSTSAASWYRSPRCLSRPAPGCCWRAEPRSASGALGACRCGSESL